MPLHVSFENIDLLNLMIAFASFVLVSILAPILIARIVIIFNQKGEESVFEIDISIFDEVSRIIDNQKKIGFRGENINSLFNLLRLKGYSVTYLGKNAYRIYASINSGNKTMLKIVQRV